MARKRILSTLDTSITYDALGLDIAKEEALRGFEWVSAWLSGIMPSGAPPPTPWRSPPRGSGKGGR